MNKLAIITTHPIQYNAPIFRLLAERGRESLNMPAFAHFTAKEKIKAQVIFFNLVVAKYADN